MGLINHNGKGLFNGKLRQVVGMKPKSESADTSIIDKIADATGVASKVKSYLYIGGAILLVLILRPWEWFQRRRR